MAGCVFVLPVRVSSSNPSAGTQLVDLKAAVFRAEQERGAGERGSVRGKVGAVPALFCAVLISAPVTQKRSRPSKRQRAGLSIGGKNVGVDRRAARDAAVAAGDAERAAKKLRAKAKLYEKLCTCTCGRRGASLVSLFSRESRAARGGRYSDGDDDDRGENGRAECLVDFDMKPRHDLHGTQRRRRRGSDSSGSDDDAGVLQSQHECAASCGAVCVLEHTRITLARRGRYGKVTIVDEFGRERVLSKRSSEYKRHVEEQRRRQREERRAQREALRGESVAHRHREWVAERTYWSGGGARFNLNTARVLWRVQTYNQARRTPCRSMAVYGNSKYLRMAGNVTID